MCFFQELQEHALNYTRKYVHLSVWQARLPNEIFAFFWWRPMDEVRKLQLRPEIPVF